MAGEWSVEAQYSTSGTAAQAACAGAAAAAAAAAAAPVAGQGKKSLRKAKQAERAEADRAGAERRLQQQAAQAAERAEEEARREQARQAVIAKAQAEYEEEAAAAKQRAERQAAEAAAIVMPSQPNKSLRAAKAAASKQQQGQAAAAVTAAPQPANAAAGKQQRNEAAAAAVPPSVNGAASKRQQQQDTEEAPITRSTSEGIEVSAEVPPVQHAHSGSSSKASRARTPTSNGTAGHGGARVEPGAAPVVPPPQEGDQESSIPEEFRLPAGYQAVRPPSVQPPAARKGPPRDSFASQPAMVAPTRREQLTRAGVSGSEEWNAKSSQFLFGVMLLAGLAPATCSWLGCWGVCYVVSSGLGFPAFKCRGCFAP